MNLPPRSIGFVGYRLPFPENPVDTSSQVHDWLSPVLCCLGGNGNKPDGPRDNEITTCGALRGSPHLGQPGTGLPGEGTAQFFPVLTLSYVAVTQCAGLFNRSTDHPASTALLAVVELRGPGSLSVKLPTAASKQRGRQGCRQGNRGCPSGWLKREKKAHIQTVPAKTRRWLDDPMPDRRANQLLCFMPSRDGRTVNDG